MDRELREIREFSEALHLIRLMGALKLDGFDGGAALDEGDGGR